MPIRVKKLIGMIVIVVYMVFYAMIATAIAANHLLDTSHLVQALYFLVAGVLWGVPMLPLIRWMQRPAPAHRTVGDDNAR